jgi:hypothetical protein
MMTCLARHQQTNSPQANGVVNPDPPTGSLRRHLVHNNLGHASRPAHPKGRLFWRSAATHGTSNKSTQVARGAFAPFVRSHDRRSDASKRRQRAFTRGSKSRTECYDSGHPAPTLVRSVARVACALAHASIDRPSDVPHFIAIILVASADRTTCARRGGLDRRANPTHTD